MVLNNVSKCHKVVIKITGTRNGTPSKKVTLHEERAISPENMVRYRPLSKLKKTLWY